jgi:hypothetical protein
MGERMTCPGCQQALRLPANRRIRWLTCPRCLSRVANPEVPAAEGIQAEPPAGPAPRPDAIQVGPASPPDTGTDGDRDYTAGEGCLVLLGLLGGLVLVVVVLSAISEARHGKFAVAAGTTVGLVIVVGISAAAVASWGGSKKGEGELPGRAFFGTLALSGCLVIILGTAYLVFAFLTVRSLFQDDGWPPVQP